MYRWRSDESSSPKCCIALAVCAVLAAVNAVPVGPLPNVTSSELGLREGSCAVGDVVYLPGDEFPGSSPCEKCSCADGGVNCSKQRCEPRPGCKALHRPDHCCPTYQCECEQEGRVYGNGEKLVDPADPCRVCYCQGGEVVCRRIACFVRDDCRPRLVPGRCCPEYDNCPLRGVTSIPGVAPSMSIPSTPEDVIPTAPKENIKQEITIKEITPVSEIPIITDVKIKEILPSPSIEVTEYSSSKSPLIPREATSEKDATDNIEATERPVVIEIRKPSATVLLSSLSPPETTASSETLSVSKNDDSTPSKFSFSTQDSINSEIYPSNIPNVQTIGSSEMPEMPVSKAPVIIEEEDAPFDHNPAFPPIPDDLSVLGNHEDEIIPEQNIYSEHVSSGHDVVSLASVTSTEVSMSSEVSPKDVSTTSEKDMDTTTTTAIVTTTEKASELPIDISSTQSQAIITTTEVSTTKENLMLNLRSAIPTEILNVPSLVPEEITGELDEEESSTSTQSTPIATTTNNYNTSTVISTEIPASSGGNKLQSTVDTTVTYFETTTNKAIETTKIIEYPKVIQEQTTSSIAKSNIPTEVTSQTEFSSLPVETSDQNPHDAKENTVKDKTDPSIIGSSIIETEPTKTIVVEPDVITVSKARPVSTENFSPEIVETTEFVLTSLGASESATDAVELIQISPDSDKSAAIIEPATERKKNSVLTELINLVGDVASISDHTDGPNDSRHITSSTGISDSEELIPVNAGYKSKNSNYNLNSITEITPKSKNQIVGNKQKVLEIEGDDDDGHITDAPPPNDKIEPTTRRPIIDNVSDDMVANKTDKVDIEIIKQAYVPTVERRPTKVVLKNNEMSVSEETLGENNPISSSAERSTEISVSSETVTSTPSDISSESGERMGQLSKSTPSTSVQ